MAKILLAENDESIRTGLVDMLEDYGHEVRAVTDGVEAMDDFRSCTPDLVLLDVGMPRKSGFAVCEEIRAVNATVPVLFLTAKTGEASRVRGLLIGGDDYIDKTVGEGELMARIDVALRRVNAFRSEGRAPSAAVKPDGRAEGGLFRFESWTVSEPMLEMVRDGERTPLYRDEVVLLRLFSEHPRETLRKECIQSLLWGRDVPTSDALRQRIHRLVERLGGDGATIESVRGVGYRYMPRKGAV